jgi:hypothetical protein
MLEYEKMPICTSSAYAHALIQVLFSALFLVIDNLQKLLKYVKAIMCILKPL